MKKIRTTNLLAIGTIAFIAIIALVSCAQGIPVEDAREMQEEMVSISNRVQQIETTLLEFKESKVDTSDSELQREFDDLINELREVTTRMASIEAKLDFPEPEEMDPNMPSGPAPATGL
jgi:hypothetical protein